jgi:3-deoxy-D-manno-octulosonate 8-phosphate phosphatase (KDO 8-P phosphatase)
VRELGLDVVITNREDKASAYAQFLDEHGARVEHVAYLGDDLVDLPVLLRCGLSFAPADAAPEVKDRVDHLLVTPGGSGAVREMVEWLLRARGDWDGLVDSYLS